ncbi:MAG: hypothetical protein Unbinned8210contig1002_33 [Prokaryotic dsDNA virus sp.]|nr:MAG: hypothetical protein Unbinned8210contig1002_33 [Prokaryotic dsDNA virus sp.]|tara:strand:+ start:1849 stop:2106 length:258 start_codon:yes stop_codon:yes gene_type:complete
MADKNYVASSIKKVTTQYGDLFNASFKVEDLQKISKRGWVNITIAERREPSEKGATHYAYENTYEPPKEVTTDAKSSKDDDDLPF